MRNCHKTHIWKFQITRWRILVGFDVIYSKFCKTAVFEVLWVCLCMTQKMSRRKTKRPIEQKERETCPSFLWNAEARTTCAWLFTAKISCVCVCIAISSWERLGVVLECPERGLPVSLYLVFSEGATLLSQNPMREPVAPACFQSAASCSLRHSRISDFLPLHTHTEPY